MECFITLSYLSLVYSRLHSRYIFPFNVLYLEHDLIFFETPCVLKFLPIIIQYSEAYKIWIVENSNLLTCRALIWYKMIISILCQHEMSFAIQLHTHNYCQPLLKLKIISRCLRFTSLHVWLHSLYNTLFLVIHDMWIIFSQCHRMTALYLGNMGFLQKKREKQCPRIRCRNEQIKYLLLTNLGMLHLQCTVWTYCSKNRVGYEGQ